MGDPMVPCADRWKKSKAAPDSGGKIPGRDDGAIAEMVVIVRLECSRCPTAISKGRCTLGSYSHVTGSHPVTPAPVSMRADY